IDALWARPVEATVLRSAAAAANALGLDEAELRFLNAALAVSPPDAQTLRLIAQAFTRQGLFEDAYRCWSELLAAQSDDEEAKQAVNDLRELASSHGLAA